MTDVVSQLSRCSSLTYHPKASIETKMMLCNSIKYIDLFRAVTASFKLSIKIYSYAKGSQWLSSLEDFFCRTAMSSFALGYWRLLSDWRLFSLV